jgi:hypothetical protein
LDKVFQALKSAGCDPKRSGDDWKSTCPAHDDRNPSLSISGKDGLVLVHCHAGCSTPNILAAIDLKPSDLFPDNPSHKPEIVAEYNYRDEDGALLYQVLRYSPKGFKQRRPDGVGDWVWNLKGVDRVPYHLPELVEAVRQGCWIIVVEGEADCDRLVKLGFAATTNAGGAGKWDAKWSRYFRGARVASLPDNDEPGRNHAQHVASCLSSVASVVKVIDLPGLPEHGDVSTWLATGGSADELKRLADEAQSWRPNSSVVSLEEIDAKGPSTGELLDRVKTALERFIVFRNDSQSVTLALWVLHTHVFEEFDTTPYLAVSSPTKQAGKTRLFEVLSALVARSWSAVEATEAVLFRKIALSAPTLLLDEIDAAFGKDSTLTEGIRAILNAGYRRGAVVPRCSGPAFDLKDFSVYCPKAFAGIGDKLPDTVRDRAIPIELWRRGPSDAKPDRLRRATIESDLQPLGAEISAWAEASRSDLSDARPSLPDELSDRQQDAWEVLFAIAELAGCKWPDLARKAAIALHGGATDQDVGVLLLRHLRELFDEVGTDALATKAILVALIDRGDDSPWARWWGEDVSREQTKGPASRLARLLKPYGVAPKTIRLDQEQTAKGYFSADFKDSWARYLTVSGESFPTSCEKDVTTSHPWSGSISGPSDLREEIVSEQDCYVVTSSIALEIDQTTTGPDAAPGNSADSNDIKEDSDIILKFFPGAELIDEAGLAELSSSTQHKCVSCGDPVTPTSGSIESGWATVCKTCSEDLLRRESRK